MRDSVRAAIAMLLLVFCAIGVSVMLVRATRADRQLADTRTELSARLAALQARPEAQTAPDITDKVLRALRAETVEVKNEVTASSRVIVEHIESVDAKADRIRRDLLRHRHRSE